MPYIRLKCKNCGSNMSLNTESHSATCTHCSSTYLLSELLDEKDMAFAEKFTPKNLEKKIMAQGAIKQGETFLFQAEFEKAETSFKRAIDLDDTNYKAYLGVVKAKTQNLNIIPDSDDYLQYAHYALSLAEDDDLILVKSELAKIELLRREKNRQRKPRSSKKSKKEKQQDRRRRTSKIIIAISCFILAMLAAFIFITSNISTLVFEGVNLTTSKEIDVDSYETLNQVFSSKKYLGYEINLTNDIDCENQTITPLGTEEAPFTGSFNGNKHKISNLKIAHNSGNYSNSGLFGYTKLANINNLILDGVVLDITNADSAINTTSCGLLAGHINSTIIKNIEIKDTCLVSLHDNINNTISVGALIGKASKSSHISNISSHAEVSCVLNEINTPKTICVGGVIGLLEDSDIQNTCSNSQISASVSNTTHLNPTTYVGGLAGYADLAISSEIANLNNNFFSGSVSVSSKNVNCKISALLKCSALAMSNLNNYCMFTSNNFIHNATKLTISELADYHLNGYYVNYINSNASYLNSLQAVFTDWKNTNSFTPSLI